METQLENITINGAIQGEAVALSAVSIQEETLSKVLVALATNGREEIFDSVLMKNLSDSIRDSFNRVNIERSEQNELSIGNGVNLADGAFSGTLYTSKINGTVF
ncbi:Uncharacterised protein [Yersinia frederiksenii]|nr:Uncharacterised protein [Yersinia frederiksenii]